MPILDFGFWIKKVFWYMPRYAIVNLKSLSQAPLWSLSIPSGSAVTHGGNPLGASLSLWEKTTLLHQNYKSKIQNCLT
ncbi:hypothetical protein CDG76_25905 [Nostoc sp. 'Peltigera membranacea cyanobiont' 210A]|nr:hypothetical protein CDG76_25905 [Nostoc sp. 'Peltigera membranacea cyanobiont' 210A]